MRYVCLFFLFIFIFNLAPMAQAEESSLMLDHNLLTPTEPPSYLAQLDTEESESTEEGASVGNQKSVPKTFLMSALLPGMGHLYVGKKYGLMYTAIEIAAWTTYFVFDSYNGKGDDKVDEYKQFAADHYSVDQYIEVRNDLMEVALSPDKVVVDGETSIYVSYDPATGDFYPSTYYSLLANEFCGSPWDEYKDCSQNEYARYDHEYYEDIGKYGKYILGWDDWYATAGRDVNGNPTQYDSNIWQDYGPYGWSPHDAGYPEEVRTSENRNEYNEIRDDAESYYDKADQGSLGMIAALANRVVATLDAVRLAKRHNRTVAEMPKERPLDWQFSVNFQHGEPEARLGLIKTY